jgi:hypothetical protein
MTRAAAFPFPRVACTPGLALACGFSADLDLVAGLRGLCARDVPLVFGFGLPGMRTGIYSIRRRRSQRSRMSEDHGTRAARAAGEP